MRRSAALVLLAAVLAACGSGPAQPLTASQLAHKIPGCHGFASGTPSVLAVADVSCTDGTETVDVVTFASTGNETRWIQAQGPWYGCCVQGHLWAATYNSGTPMDGFAPVIRALGGREVTG